MHIPANLPALPEMPGGIDLPRITSPAAAGIAVAIAGNVLISLARNCQKLAHRRLESERKVVGQELRRPPPHRSTSAPHGPALQRPTQSLNTTHSTPVAAVAILVDEETEPLLESGDRVQSGNGAQTPKPSRRWLFSHRNPARDADSYHLASTHALMPVDILPVHPEDNEDQSGSVQKEDSEDASEGNYLKSKLWCVIFLAAFNISSMRFLRWFGFLLMNVGECGNFISYAFAPASVVAPLGTVRYPIAKLYYHKTNTTLSSLP